VQERQDDRPSPKAGKVVDPRADLLGKREVFKTKLCHLAGEGANQIELQLKDNTTTGWLKQQL
jgi:hypothetical protein